MPEGPSIVILKELVHPFKGQTVEKASNNNNKLDIAILKNQKVTDFKTWGKSFFICFKKFSIRIHFGLFGSYRINEHTAKPARLHLQFDDSELNFYACTLQLIEEPLDKLYDFTADVMNPKWSSPKALAKMLAEPQMLASDALMNQQIFSGVGNIIKNEVLFRTRIHPLSEVGQIPAKKLKEMVHEAVKYTFEFLEQKKAGTLKKHWLAYKKATCPRDNVPFQIADTGKSRRRTFYCDKCMVLYK
ncbi:MAG: DNA-formamidopyrimidine glycosylase family protein [Mucilaginibacter sp.]|uniref:DNA-formamidopyrimidine glycosylase family protein n=1 Tax=Mucilaginibacter sp. TaxID=1882438 RepID=UPI0032676D49